jgi:hypothetical protein
MKINIIAIALLVLLALATFGLSQVGVPTATSVQMTQALYPVTPISNSAAVANQVTLTIPTPPAGMFNYICSLHFNVTQNATSTVCSNCVTTSTNFNGWATKFSIAATVEAEVDQNWVWGQPGFGCAKSATAGTSTTFVSPASLTNAAFSWDATYYVAP